MRLLSVRLVGTWAGQLEERWQKFDEVRILAISFVHYGPRNIYIFPSPCKVCMHIKLYFT